MGNTIYYLNSSPPMRLRRHEEKHIEQYKQYGICGYLTRYFYHYIRNRFRGMNHDTAYRNIPFEIEAFAAEDIC